MSVATAWAANSFSAATKLATGGTALSMRVAAGAGCAETGSEKPAKITAKIAKRRVGERPRQPLLAVADHVSSVLGWRTQADVARATQLKRFKSKVDF